MLSGICHLGYVIISVIALVIIGVLVSGLPTTIMSLPAVLQHLQVLEQSGLVKTEKVGRVRTCKVETKALRSVEQWISARRTAWEERFDRLGAYLAAEAAAEKRKK